jgi:hypothetical protein
MSSQQSPALFATGSTYQTGALVMDPTYAYLWQCTSGGGVATTNNFTNAPAIGASVSDGANSWAHFPGATLIATSTTIANAQSALSLLVSIKDGGSWTFQIIAQFGGTIPDEVVCTGTPSGVTFKGNYVAGSSAPLVSTVAAEVSLARTPGWISSNSSSGVFSLILTGTDGFGNAFSQTLSFTSVAKPPTNGPIFAGLTPSPSTTLATTTTAITGTLKSPSGPLVAATVIAEYPDGTSEKVWDVSGGFSDPFTGSTATPTSVSGLLQSVALSIVRGTGGWLQAPTLRAVVTDGLGFALDGTNAWTIPALTLGPVVENLVPPASAGGAVSFELADGQAPIESATVWAAYPPNPDRELIFDGNTQAGFTPRYASSTLTQTDSQRWGFAIVRAEGFPANCPQPAISVRSIDTNGNGN